LLSWKPCGDDARAARRITRLVEYCPTAFLFKNPIVSIQTKASSHAMSKRISRNLNELRHKMGILLSRENLSNSEVLERNWLTCGLPERLILIGPARSEAHSDVA
jgi:hypothetical protein